MRLNMFDIVQKFSVGNEAWTLRTISGKNFHPFLEITCLNNEGEDIEDDAYSGINLLSTKTLEDIYNNVHCYRLWEDKHSQEKEAISKELKYWSNYLAQKVCRLLEKAWYILSSDNLFNVLREFRIEHGDVCSPKDYVGNIGVISNIKNCFECIKKSDISWGLSCFSDVGSFSSLIKKDVNCDFNKLFKIIDTCNDQCDFLWLKLYCLSLNIAKICKIKEVQQDYELMSKLYPIYKEIECFLKKEQKVDLSEYEKKVAREEAQAREKEEIKDRLLENTLKLVGDMSKFIMQNTGQSIISSEDVHKLTDSMDKLTEQLAKTCKNDIPTGINNIMFHNAIEGQEPQVEVQAMATD